MSSTTVESAYSNGCRGARPMLVHDGEDADGTEASRTEEMVREGRPVDSNWLDWAARRRAWHC